MDMKTASYGKWLRLLERLIGPEADDGQSEGFTTSSLFFTVSRKT
jgi:hypothetical protein